MVVVIMKGYTIFVIILMLLYTARHFYFKNFDYPEKPLKYKHIRRISD